MVMHMYSTCRQISQTIFVMRFQHNLGCCCILATAATSMKCCRGISLDAAGQCEQKEMLLLWWHFWLQARTQQAGQRKLFWAMQCS